MLNYLTNRFEEKRQAFDLLKSYNPWGKPGCGAPNPHALRRHNLLVDGIFPEVKFKRVQFPESALLERRRNRSAVRTRHRDSTLYYHPNSKATVENILRWKTPLQDQLQYRKCLDDIIAYKKKMGDEELKKNIEYEKKMLHSHGPWGAKGPGGRPWRHPGNVGKDFFDSMGWTTEGTFTLPPIKKYHVTHQDTKEPNPKNITSNVQKLQAIENIPRRNNETEYSLYNMSVQNRLGISANEQSRKECNCDQPSKPFGIPSNNEETRGGGTPNEKLLQLTGGIELVPLLRGRRKPRLFSGHKKWRARDPEYLKVLTEQVRMQQSRRKNDHNANVRFEKSHNEEWHRRWDTVRVQ